MCAHYIFVHNLCTTCIHHVHMSQNTSRRNILDNSVWAREKDVSRLVTNCAHNIHESRSLSENNIWARERCVTTRHELCTQYTRVTNSVRQLYMGERKTCNKGTWHLTTWCWEGQSRIVHIIHTSHELCCTQIYGRVRGVPNESYEIVGKQQQYWIYVHTSHELHWTMIYVQKKHMSHEPCELVGKQRQYWIYIYIRVTN